jgi:hypothetical protein
MERLAILRRTPVFSFILNVVGSILDLYCVSHIGSLPVVRCRVGLRDWFAARVEQIRALRPDLVVMLKIPAFPAMSATKSAKGEDNAAGKN